MALKLPIKTGVKYRTNNGDEITFVEKGGENSFLWSPEVALWFSVKTGAAPSTSYRVVEEIAPDATETLKQQHEAMMQRLKELYS